MVTPNLLLRAFSPDLKGACHRPFQTASFRSLPHVPFMNHGFLMRKTMDWTKAYTLHCILKEKGFALFTAQRWQPFNPQAVA